MIQDFYFFVSYSAPLTIDSVALHSKLFLFSQAADLLPSFFIKAVLKSWSPCGWKNQLILLSVFQVPKGLR